MAGQSKRADHERRLQQLQALRTPYESLWQACDEYIAPGRLRLHDDRNKLFKDKHKNIINESLLIAWRVFAAGMYSGMCSPSRPWFKGQAIDPDLRNDEQVKDYYHTATTRMRDILQGSNVYNSQHAGFGDLGQFGQSCKLLVGDFERVIRSIHLITGQYWIAQNVNQQVDTCYRRHPMTAEQVVKRFVYRGDKNNKPNWSIVSPTIRTLYDKNPDADIPVFHAIEPRKGRDVNSAMKNQKPFTSNYWEQGGPRDVMLEESGFDYNPIVCDRWDTIGNDVYGSNHPGEIALGSSRQLQQEEMWKGIGIERIVDGPLQAPTALQNFGVDTMPGGITFADVTGGGAQGGIRPIYDVRMDLDHLNNDIDRVENRGARIFYNDIIMAISQMEGVQPKNVFELTARKEEQMQQFGPVIERQQFENLNRVVDITYAICAQRGMFPPLPKELEGQRMLIDHISVMAQAQKAISVGSIERSVSFAGNLAAIKPDIMDNFDLDKAVLEYSDSVGAPPSIIVSEDKVAQARAKRAQQQQQVDQANMAATMAPAAAQGAQAAKLLAETGQLTGNSKLPPSNEILSKLGIAG